MIGHLITLLFRRTVRVSGATWVVRAERRALTVGYASNRLTVPRDTARAAVVPADANVLVVPPAYNMQVFRDAEGQST
jgi:hypothetical protein